MNESDEIDVFQIFHGVLVMLVSSSESRVPQEHRVAWHSVWHPSSGRGMSHRARGAPWRLNLRENQPHAINTIFSKKNRVKRGHKVKVVKFAKKFSENLPELFFFCPTFF